MTYEKLKDLVKDHELEVMEVAMAWNALFKPLIIFRQQFLATSSALNITLDSPCTVPLSSFPFPTYDAKQIQVA